MSDLLVCGSRRRGVAEDMSVVGSAELVHVPGHHVDGDPRANATEQRAQQEPQKQAGAVLVDLHAVALTDLLHPVALFVVPEVVVNAAGHDGQQDHNDVVGAFLPVALPQRVQVIDKNIPQ